MLKTNQEYLDQIKKVGEYNLKDTYKWRERALFFQEKSGENWSEGYYTDLIEGTLDWDVFWDEEERRIMEGLRIDGFYIPGLFYFYLNYLPIYRKQDNEYNFPDVYDSDYHTFLCLEHAVFLKKHFGVIKKRQCIDRDSFIYTPLGVETIENLFKQNYKGEVYSLNTQKELVVDTIEDIWIAKKVNQILKITLTGGKTLECTDKHKINTTIGWKEAKDLKLKDILYIIKPPFGSISIEQSEAIVMGYFFADGSYSQKNIAPKFTNTNQDYLNDFEYHLLKWRNDSSIRKHIKGNGYDYVISNKERSKGRPNPFKRYLFDQGLCNKDAERTIPVKYMNLNEESTALMVNRIFAGDGWLSRIHNSRSNSYRYEIGIGSMSLKFLNQLSFLLSKFNISSSIRETNFGKKQKKKFYKLRIYKTTESEKFLIKIGIFKKDDNLDIIKIHNDKENTSQIKKIQIVEKETLTYDLKTKNTSSFFANGIHVHNSGFSLKFCAPLIRELWFSRGSPNYIATYEEPQVQKAWAEILEPYREHLNVYTPWYRDLNPDKTLNWRVAKELVTETGRKVTKGRMNSLKGLVLSKSASKGVGGGAKWIFADEAGVNLVLSKFLGYVKPMISYGNVTTGTIIVSGAVGELKHLDGGLKDVIVNPEAQNFYWVDNIWDKDNEYEGKRCGFFVPESWAYYGVDENGVPFVDEHGNSDLPRTETYILKQREEIKSQSLESYMFAISQGPLSLMECFQYRSESVFPKDIIDHQISAIEMKKDHGTYIDLYETEKKLVKHKLLSKFENEPILDFPVKPKEIKNKDGVIQVWEFPMERPPYGLYWAGVDICRDSESLNSPSIHCIDIFKGTHKLSQEFAHEKPVASYRCRPKDKMDFYKKAMMLLDFYNAEALVENNVRWFIQEVIKDKKQHKISKTPKWLMDITPTSTSQLTAPYGVPMTSKLKDELIDTLVRYVSKVIYISYDEKTGEPTEHFGVENIKNIFVLREMLAWKPIKEQTSKDNYDNLISLGLAIMSAEKAEMLGIIQDDNYINSFEDLINRKNSKLKERSYISKSRSGYITKSNSYLSNIKKRK